MIITKVNGYDDCKNPGDYWFQKEDNHLFLNCICGKLISIKTTGPPYHTITSEEPLTIEGSIRHIGPECHFYIREGKYVQA